MYGRLHFVYAIWRAPNEGVPACDRPIVVPYSHRSHIWRFCLGFVFATTKSRPKLHPLWLFIVVYELVVKGAKSAANTTRAAEEELQAIAAGRVDLIGFMATSLVGAASLAY